MMKKLLKCDCFAKWGAVSPLILRVVVGLIFVMHGWQKLTVMQVGGVEGMLNALGFPMAALLAPILIAAELGGGILLILGLFTHWSAKILAFVGLVALVAVHLKNGFFMATGGYEFILLIFVATVSVLITGPGKYSLDAKVHKKHA
jgi:putative oxidoreductase